MPERPDEPDEMESPLSPADDARIRRLLADARHTEPMPAHVVQRLDGVLADLHARRTEESPAVVVDLASRRRRTAASLLVAAAAVVVAGVGLGQILPTGGSDSASSGGVSAADMAPQQEAGGGSAGAPKSSDSSEAQSVAPGPDAPADGALKNGEVHIRAEHFGADVRAARTALNAAQPDAITEFAAPPTTCAAGIPGDGTVVAATYEGAAAALVLRPPAGDVQVVDLYLCETTEPIRSITLTVP